MLEVKKEGNLELIDFFSYQHFSTQIDPNNVTCCALIHHLDMRIFTDTGPWI